MSAPTRMTSPSPARSAARPSSARTTSSSTDVGGGEELWCICSTYSAPLNCNVDTQSRQLQECWQWIRDQVMSSTNNHSYRLVSVFFRTAPVTVDVEQFVICEQFSFMWSRASDIMDSFM